MGSLQVCHNDKSAPNDEIPDAIKMIKETLHYQQSDSVHHTFFVFGASVSELISIDKQYY